VRPAGSRPNQTRRNQLQATSQRRHHAAKTSPANALAIQFLHKTSCVTPVTSKKQVTAQSWGPRGTIAVTKRLAPTLPVPTTTSGPNQTRRNQLQAATRRWGDAARILPASALAIHFLDKTSGVALVTRKKRITAT